MVHHLDGLAGTGAGAVAAAVAGRRVDGDDALRLVHPGHPVGAGAHASETDDAFLRVNRGHGAADVHIFLGQDAQGPGRRPLGLGDALGGTLGAVGQPAKKDALLAKSRGRSF